MPGVTGVLSGCVANKQLEFIMPNLTIHTVLSLKTAALPKIGANGQTEFGLTVVVQRGTTVIEEVWPCTREVANWHNATKPNLLTFRLWRMTLDKGVIVHVSEQIHREGTTAGFTSSTDPEHPDRVIFSQDALIKVALRYAPVSIPDVLLNNTRKVLLDGWEKIMVGQRLPIECGNAQVAAVNLRADGREVQLDMPRS